MHKYFNIKIYILNIMPPKSFDPLRLKYKIVYYNIYTFGWILFIELTIKCKPFLIYLNNEVSKIKIIAFPVDISIKLWQQEGWN
jgi:hypothetical protein